MNFHKFLIPALALACVFSACTKEEAKDEGESKEQIEVKLSLSKTSADVVAAGDQVIIAVTCNASWTASCSENWVTLSSTSGKNSGTTTVTVAANDGDARTATVVFSAESKTASFTVNQAKYEESEPGEGGEGEGEGGEGEGEGGEGEGEGGEGEGATYELSVIKAFAADLSSLDIKTSNVRNIAYDGTYLYFGQTTSPIVAVDANGATTTLEWNSEWTVGYTGCITGLRTVKNGEGLSLLVANATGPKNDWANASQELGVYFYSSPTATPTKVITYTLPTVGRMGDYLEFYGTWQNGQIIFGNGTENVVYAFTVTQGTVNSTPAKYEFQGPAGVTDAVAGMFKLDDNTFVYSRENSGSEVYTFDGLSLTLQGTMSINIKTPRVFSYDGKNWLAFRTTNEKAGYYDVVYVCEITGDNLTDFLLGCDGSDAAATYSILQDVANGNYFASLEVYADTDEVRIGTNSRGNSSHILKFCKK